MIHVVVNAILFQLAWFSLVMDKILLGSLCVTAMMAHVIWQAKHTYRVLIFLCCVVSLGVISDTGLSMLSVYEFQNTTLDFPFIPIWLVLLWIGFALTLNLALNWLVSQLKFSLILFSVFGPLSYWLGSQLNPQAISVSMNYLPLIVLQWGIMAWVIYWLKHTLQLTVSDDGYGLHES